MNLFKTKTAKIVAGFVGLAMVFAFVVAPTNTSAQTVEELQQQIQQLLNLIQQLQGSGSSNTGIPDGFQFTRDLTVGSSGTDAMYLQMALNSWGYTVATTGAGSAGNETQTFGSLTKAALASYQASQGISPAVGYFGPITRTNVNAKLAMSDNNDDDDDSDDSNDDSDNNDDTTLKGGAGDIESLDFVSKYNNEEVGEDQSDVEIVGYEIEATEGSDIEITALTLDFDNTDTNPNGASDDDLDDYADEVSVWFNGEEVARVDARTFDDDNNYRRSVSLDRGVIIRAGETEDLTVAVSGVSNLDSANEQEVWNVGLVSLRFRDAQSAIITYNSGTDMETTPDNDTTTDSDERPFSFESFATASDVELKIAKDDKSINDARSIMVDDTDDTDGVEILSFTLEAEGDSDIEIKDLPIFWTAVGANVNGIINSAELMIDGESVGSENVSISATTGTTTFDQIDYVISAGDTVHVVVEVDVNDIQAGTFDEGDTLSATFGEIQTDSSSFDAEDEEGNNLADSAKTGSASSDAHTFYSNGIQVSLVSTNTEEVTIDGNDNDYVNLTMVFSVTSFGQDAWVRNITTDVSTSTSSTGGTPLNSQGVGFHLQSSDYATVASSSIVETMTSTADEGTNAFEVNEGDTENFTLKVTVTNDATENIDAEQFRVILTGIGFAGTDSSTNGDYTVFTSNLQSDFKTGYARVAN